MRSVFERIGQIMKGVFRNHDQRVVTGERQHKVILLFPGQKLQQSGLNVAMDNLDPCFVDKGTVQFLRQLAGQVGACRGGLKGIGLRLRCKVRAKQM